MTTSTSSMPAENALGTPGLGAPVICEPYRADVVSRDEEFAGLRQAWDDLLERSGQRNVFLSWEWMYHWWMNFKSSKALYLVVIRAAMTGEMIGIAPLCIDRFELLPMLEVKKLKLLASEFVHSDFLECIALPERKREFYAALIRHLTDVGERWDVMETSDIDSSSPALALLREHAGKRYRLFEQPSAVCPYIGLASTYEDFLSSLTSKMRGDLTRKTKRFLSQFSDVSFSCNDVSSSARRSLDELFHLHQENFRHKDVASSFRGSRIRQFHLDISHAFCDRGWLRMYRLEQAGSLVACLYAFAFKGRLFCYQTAIDLLWRPWSPGTVLTGYSIRDCIGEGIGEFHYLRGSEAYKWRWTRRYLSTRTLTVINNSFRGGMYLAYIQSRSRIRLLLRGASLPDGAKES